MVAVEQVLTFWVAVAKAEGTAEITASNSAGERGSMTLTVGSAALAAPEAPTIALPRRCSHIWGRSSFRSDRGS